MVHRVKEIGHVSDFEARELRERNDDLCINERLKLDIYGMYEALMAYNTDDDVNYFVDGINWDALTGDDIVRLKKDYKECKFAVYHANYKGDLDDLGFALLKVKTLRQDQDVEELHIIDGLKFYFERMRAIEVLKACGWEDIYDRYTEVLPTSPDTMDAVANVVQRHHEDYRIICGQPDKELPEWMRIDDINKKKIKCGSWISVQLKKLGLSSYRKKQRDGNKKLLENLVTLHPNNNKQETANRTGRKRRSTRRRRDIVQNIENLAEEHQIQQIQEMNIPQNNNAVVFRDEIDDDNEEEEVYQPFIHDGSQFEFNE